MLSISCSESATLRKSQRVGYLQSYNHEQIFQTVESPMYQRKMKGENSDSDISMLGIRHPTRSPARPLQTMDLEIRVEPFDIEEFRLEFVRILRWAWDILLELVRTRWWCMKLGRLSSKKHSVEIDCRDRGMNHRLEMDRKMRSCPKHERTRERARVVKYPADLCRIEVARGVLLGARREGHPQDGYCGAAEIHLKQDIGEVWRDIMREPSISGSEVIVSKCCSLWRTDPRPTLSFTLSLSLLLFLGFS